VQLDIEAPESVALNAGGVRPFPRVNGYVLVPVDDGHLVGQVEWLTVERSSFPKRRGVQDFGLIDLPYPLRRMSLNPLGTLRRCSGTAENYIFRRGADALPSVGAAVCLPTQKQLRSIVESGERRRVCIGTSPLAANAAVKIDPDRLFGRHLAVLGNTGSGKSCSVAGLIRWSLEAARSSRGDGGAPNARFIILDPNGEYTRAFSDARGAVKVRIFSANAEDADSALRVPVWFWNGAEWAAFTQASARAQKPALIQALRCVRDGFDASPESTQHELRRFLRTVVTTLQIERNSGSPWGSFPKPKSFFEKLEKWRSGLKSDVTEVTAFADKLEDLCAPRRVQHPHYDFERADVESLIELARRAHASVGGSDDDVHGADADAPRPFGASAFIRSVEATAEMMGVAEFTETLLLRIRALLSDVRMKSILGDEEISLEHWLEQYVGRDDAEFPLTILDLSLVPSDVIHTITAVVARMVFEALQRYRKLNGKALPTVLVMEEAHTFVRRYRDDVENQDAATVCCQVFERIAREGRKFGMGGIGRIKRVWAQGAG
jgi:DNA helicase HerA-like ATPase